MKFLYFFNFFLLYFLLFHVQEAAASGKPENVSVTLSINDLSAPSNLSARPVSETEIRLEWKVNSSKHKGFRIERSQSRNGGFAQIAEIGKNSSSYNDKNLKAGTTYYYRIRAYGKKKEVSDFSNTAEATTPSAAQALVAPANLTAKAISTSQIDLSWTNQSSNDKGVKVERSLHPNGNFTEVAIVSKGGAHYSNHGLSPNTHYYFRIRSHNEQGHSEYSNVASATTLAGTLNTVLIKSKNFPAYYTAGSSTEAASITLNENAQVSKVEAFYRGITQSEWRMKELSPAAGNVYQLKFGELALDEIGFRYYFRIQTPLGTSTSSESAYTYITFPGQGLNIPDLKFGSSAASYQMVSVPLELKDKSVAAVLEDDLGKYNKSKWRLGHYEGEEVKEYQDGLNAFEPGKSYWLIVRKKTTINTGEGSTFAVSSESPFTMQLKAGWNQIGNPYLFNVAWEDVMASSKPAKVGELYVYDGGYKQSDVLHRFSGGFVYTDTPIKLVFPVLKSGGPNTKSTLADLSSPFSTDEQWTINFYLSAENEEIDYTLGGLGMHPAASFGKDDYDLVALPRFGAYAELSVSHPEHPGRRFTRDIVPATEHYTWEFDASSSFMGQRHVLSWNSNEWGNSDKQLWLLDRETQQVINMKEKSSYSFTKQEESYRFKVFFGDEEFIDKHLHPEKVAVLPAFPNPFEEKTSFHFSLPPAWGQSHVQLVVYNLQGQEVARPVNALFDPGFHKIQWNGTGLQNELLKSAMYIYKLSIRSQAEDIHHTGKLIISR